MNKELYKELLVEMIEEDEDTFGCNDITESIYIIDDLMIGGNFEYGVRSNDHNCLKFDEIEWEQILSYGTIIVPETNIYISDEVISELEDISLERFPLDKNHIVG